MTWLRTQQDVFYGVPVKESYFVNNGSNLGHIHILDNETYKDTNIYGDINLSYITDEYSEECNLSDKDPISIWWGRNDDILDNSNLKSYTVTKSTDSDGKEVYSHNIVISSEEIARHYYGDKSDVSPTLLGDINVDGIVDICDVTLMKQYIVKLSDVTDQGFANADVISDDVLDVKDLGQLLKYIIKVIESF